MHACNSANDKPVDQLARISSTKRRGREGGREKESRSNRCTREREKGVNSCEGIGGVPRGKDRKRRIACIYARRAKGEGGGRRWPVAEWIRERSTFQVEREGVGG